MNDVPADEGDGAYRRVARELGGTDIVARIAGLSGSDFASLMLEVARRRAAIETPASVLRRYRNDRFVQPGAARWLSVRRAEDLLLGCLPADVEMVTVAPLVPLGAHSALGTVSQNKVVSTIRPCEVAADPTNALALEAAARRSASSKTEASGTRAHATVRLAAIQRVTRGQLFPAGWQAHFSLFATVTAGRDEGSARFERAALAGQLRFAVAGLRAAGLAAQVALTPLSAVGETIAAAAAIDLGDVNADIVTDRGRTSGRGYYRDVCFKVNALLDGQPAEIGDGGFTDWTARLLANAKERLLISGYGLDRLAAVLESGHG
jgi:hypothetical protein